MYMYVFALYYSYFITVYFNKEKSSGIISFYLKITNSFHCTFHEFPLKLCYLVSTIVAHLTNITFTKNKKVT